MKTMLVDSPAAPTPKTRLAAASKSPLAAPSGSAHATAPAVPAELGYLAFRENHTQRIVP
jgi:hypothetical protein